MSSDDAFKFTRQSSWETFSAAAHRELVPPQFASQLQHLAYNDKYVIHFDFGDVDDDSAAQGLATLLSHLEAVGLHTEVRAGHDQSLLVFVKAPREILGNAVYKSRVRDWLYGVVAEHPGGGGQTIVDAKYEAEDLLSMHHLLSWPKEMGGAGITPGYGQFKNVQSMFPLHNPRTSQALLRYLGKKLILRDNDFDQIRDLLGAKAAFYFAFTQTYILFLIFPAITGLLARAFLPSYSQFYTILTGLWCTVFVEYWKLKQTDLSIRWNVKGVGNHTTDRPQFNYEKVIVDEVGRTRHYCPKWKQIARRLVQIPFILVAALSLGALIAVMFAIEILISETYDGQYKSYLEYLPTGLLAIFLPYISNFLEGAAAALTEFENHRTADSHERSLAQKVFVLNFTTQYLPILLTAFVYVPFGDLFVPYLERVIRYVLSDAVKFSDMPFHANPNRLQRDVIALTVTGQISHFGEEFLFPLIKQNLRSWYRNYRSSNSVAIALDGISQDDHPEEKALLSAARSQATLPPYDVQADISQMVLQFGHLALFSPVWSLMPIGFLINNWIELRSDFLKICIEHQRPPPVRTDGIAVAHMFGPSVLNLGSSSSVRWWTLPVTIVVSEHVFLAVRAMVQVVLQRIGSKQIRKERDTKYLIRKKYLDELERNKSEMLGLGVEQRERRKSVLMTAGNMFWMRQVEDGKSKAVGIQLIQMLRKPTNGVVKGSEKGKKD
ncbi:calcium-activated chloride channel domain-containing protein [Hirsutella rhossiliensis]|uniref:Calcium-activated chloride channel domain-containing protein n=1 Tax=Hirsutella rhossiliensis TaxID=111463 RepID=A0A9P8MYU4_9HYPO|nr:calcium-activated chloride channel domain-containing protein [Hirsutella rhossiliensis]KAH0963765.1 calcium-activated chloride channel domain-containing protein [Hirsutella rhossiliensis]